MWFWGSFPLTPDWPQIQALPLPTLLHALWADLNSTSMGAPHAFDSQLTSASGRHQWKISRQGLAGCYFSPKDHSFLWVILFYSYESCWFQVTAPFPVHFKIRCSSDFLLLLALKYFSISYWFPLPWPHLISYSCNKFFWSSLLSLSFKFHQNSET